MRRPVPTGCRKRRHVWWGECGRCGYCIGEVRANNSNNYRLSHQTHLKLISHIKLLHGSQRERQHDSDEHGGPLLEADTVPTAPGVSSATYMSQLEVVLQ